MVRRQTFNFQLCPQSVGAEFLNFNGGFWGRIHLHQHCCLCSFSLFSGQIAWGRYCHVFIREKFMLRKSGEALEVPLEYIGVVRLPRGVVESLSLDMCKNCVDVH